MAASANPSGSQDGSGVVGAGGGGGSAVTGGNPSNGSVAAAGVAGTAAALKHSPARGLSNEWSAEEQAILDEELSIHTDESLICRYARIAEKLPLKTIRDVALRCRWMNRKESGKRRKEDHNVRKNKDKKERVTDLSAKASAPLAARSSVPQYSVPHIPSDNDDEISFTAIGGPTGELLEQNSQFFNQISANLSSFQIQDNFNLLSKVRENIFAIMNDIGQMPGIMKQMPHLPVKVNEELANNILHPPR